jgi:uncharacterized protein (TIGR01319 family)
VALFDVAAGSYRLIARATVSTTIDPPHSDITVGVRQAISHLSEMIGRKLLNENGEIIRPSNPVGSGVDHFASVISAAAPLTTILVGLFDDVSMASARRALNSGYVSEVDSFNLADSRDEQSQVNAIIDKQPDLIFMVGGTDGGAKQRLMSLVETVSLGAGVLANIKRPQVLFAGNIKLREHVRHALGERVSIQVTNNVRPDLDTEQLGPASEAIGNLYEDIKMGALPGIQQIRDWSSFPSMPTAKAFAATIEYFAALQQTRVIGLDLGSNSTTFVVSDQGKSDLAVRTDLGMGRPITNLLDKVELETITRWVPAEIKEGELRNFVQNKNLFPQTIPLTEMELYLEQAVAREVLSNMLTEAATDWNWSSRRIPPFSLLIARGSTLAKTARPGQTVLLILDAVQPTGIFSITLDRHGVLPALGTLAAHNPLAVVQALEGGVLDDLGWVVAPTGKGQFGQKVLTVIMEMEQGRQLEIEVEYGTLEVLPMPIGQSVDITLQPERRFDIGFGPGQGKKVVLQGGAVGLVVDARGRPMMFPQDESDRIDLVRQWLWDVGG